MASMICFMLLIDDARLAAVRGPVSLAISKRQPAPD
jgi:hypothetical protein